LIDYTHSTSTPLDPAIILDEERFDPQEDDTVGPDWQTTVRVSAPYAALDITATDVPTAVVSVDPNRDYALDSITFDFHTGFESGKPQLAVSPSGAAGGQLVTFSGSGFTPLASASVMLDDATILSGLTVNPDGTLAGSFLLPSTPPVTGDFF